MERLLLIQGQLKQKVRNNTLQKEFHLNIYALLTLAASQNLEPCWLLLWKGKLTMETNIYFMSQY